MKHACLEIHYHEEISKEDTVQTVYLYDYLTEKKNSQQELTTRVSSGIHHKLLPPSYI